MVDDVCGSLADSVVVKKRSEVAWLCHIVEECVHCITAAVVDVDANMEMTRVCASLLD